MNQTTFTPKFNLNRNIPWFREPLKRSFDVIVSGIVLVLLAPLYGVIALAIRRDSPGQAIYRGQRMGRDGKKFYILKFRTMYETTKSYTGPKVTAQDDPRVTHFGRWLRDTKLNELPQFWNVLKGEMSLVGPRPEDPDIAETWPEDVKDEILSVRPGITSPASVQCRNEESMLSIGNIMQTYMEELVPDKIRLDQLYVRYRSFWLDLDTLFYTLLVLLPKLRSYSPPEKFLFLGPISRLMRRYVSWFTIDLMVTFTAICMIGYLWRLSGPLDVGWPVAIGFAVSFALLFSITGSILGVNRINWSKALDSDVLDLLPAGILATFIALFANRIMSLFPSGLILAASVLAFVGFGVVRYRTRLITGFLSRWMRRRKGTTTTQERVLIVGVGTTAQFTAWLLDHQMNSRNYYMVGFIDDDYIKQGTRIYGGRIVGTCHDIPQLVEKHDVGLIIFTDHKICTNGKDSVLVICEDTPARLVVMPDMIEMLAGINKISIPVTSRSATGGDDVHEDELRCSRCLLQSFSLNLEAQLDELENLLEMGDLAEAQSYLQDAKNTLIG